MVPPLQANWVCRVLNPSYLVSSSQVLISLETFSRLSSGEGCTEKKIFDHSLAPRAKGKSEEGKPDFIWNARARGHPSDHRKISSIRYSVAQRNGDMSLVLIWLEQFETQARFSSSRK